MRHIDGVGYVDFHNANEEYEKMIPMSAIEAIKADIEHVIDNTYDSTDYDKSLYNGAYKDGLYEALDTIDRHISEAEGVDDE